MTKPIVAAVVVAALAAAVSGCGGGASIVSHPFTSRSGGSAGPGSGLWGDTAWDPEGDHIGCISGRRYAQAVVVHNASRRAVTIVAVGGPQPQFGIIDRVAAQARLKPPADPRLAMPGLAGWSSKPLKPVAVPPDREAWLQLNFVIRDCSLLRARKHLTVPDDVVVAYRAGDANERQTIPADIPIVLMHATPSQAAAYRAQPEAG